MTTDNDVLRRLPVLETSRLILRKVRPDDLHAVHAYASDPAVTEHLVWEPHRTMDETRRSIGETVRRYEDGQLAPWAIQLHDGARMIGTCGFVVWYRHDARAEIAYVVARPYWGRGYATEAVRAVVDFGFAQMGLNRIEGRCMVENAASSRVMEKAGMRYEGTMRQQILAKGRFRDVKLYAILREDRSGWAHR